MSDTAWTSAPRSSDVRNAAFAVEMSGVEKRFGATRALRGLDLAV